MMKVDSMLLLKGLKPSRTNSKTDNYHYQFRKKSTDVRA